MPLDENSTDTRPPRVTSLAFSPDAKLIAGSTNHEVNLWRVRDGKLMRFFYVPGDDFGYGAVEFSPDGKLLAAESYGPIRIWRVADGTLVRSLSTGEREFLLGFNTNGKTLLTGSEGDDGSTGHNKASQAETWDLLQPRRKQPLFSLELSGGAAYLVRSTGHIVMASGGWWFSPADSADLNLYDLDTGKKLPPLFLPGRAQEPWMGRGEPQSGTEQNSKPQ